MDTLKHHSFCLIRHGETVANRDGIIAGRLDVALTDFGRDQARALQRSDWPESMSLFCSPKERAKESCLLAFPGKDPELVAGLVERDWGIFEGRPLAELPTRELQPEAGEAWQDFLDRVGNALVYCCAAADGAIPIMVCHSGVVRAARILTGQPTVGSRAPNAKPILFRWTGDHHAEESFHP
ncbi:histidine phosphatase family protein [Cohaesibacter celericrescens]|uniref:Histidine phosphatase family protein n=1 Tax=Cohaesibacter celericrescens TaxID=2067669 RepID=A0A2N5XRW5_9HYPH|nr:histidine phosphatase family protein [Cohaesibacter celericrescens]PLW77158.1 histidine phosphatase family protein [Cohaesibacter celericrescens]